MSSLSSHRDENISEDDDELTGMGPIEGLHGDPILQVIVGEEDDDMDDDEDDEDTSVDSEDDEDMNSDDYDDQEDRVEIAIEEGDLMDDDGNPDWESADSEDEEDVMDYDVEGHDLDEHDLHGGHIHDGDLLGNLTRAVMGGEHDFGPDDVDDLGDGYIDEGRDDDGKLIVLFPFPNHRKQLLTGFILRRRRRGRRGP
jgi:E3 ubiquitin-protein ligase HUWE1